MRSSHTPRSQICGQSRSARGPQRRSQQGGRRRSSLADVGTLLANAGVTDVDAEFEKLAALSLQRKAEAMAQAAAQVAPGRSLRRSRTMMNPDDELALAGVIGR